jgi:transposase
MSQTIPEMETTTLSQSLHLAIDLGGSSWKLAFGSGRKIRYRTITAGDLDRLEEEVAQAKRHFGLADEAAVFSCHEAGRDGFWIHRELERRGIRNVVVDSASIEQSRRKRQVKTDRVDARKLLAQLGRHLGGETKVWSVLRIPSRADEDARMLHREIERLKKEKVQLSNGIRSMLVTQGVSLRLRAEGFAEDLERLRLRDGQPIGPKTRAAILRRRARWELVMAQLSELEQSRREQLKQVDAPQSVKKAGQMMQLKGIGINTAWVLAMELFGWRHFANRRQVGALAGLSPTPWISDGTKREQGIGKAGNRRVRSMIVEVSWLWLRYQPLSALSRWFQRKFGQGGKRMHKVGIVALARKLLIALWHYVEHGVLPLGAVEA